MSLIDSLLATLYRHRIRGATRLYGWLRQGERIAVRTKHGVVCQLSPHEYVDGLVLRHGFYEEEVLDSILSRLRPGDCFWDVGANLGLHALTVAHLKPDTRVVAFEPNPALARLLRETATRNRLTLDVQEVALDAQSGTATFYVHSGNSGRSSLHNWDNDPSLTRIEVRTIRGDELVGAGKVPAPHVMKIDVEGNEARVLEGMPHLLDQPSLHSIVLEDAKEMDSPAKQILQRHGFSLRVLERKENTSHNLENFLATRSATP